jgi:hypothetical protein
MEVSEFGGGVILDISSGSKNLEEGAIVCGFFGGQWSNVPWLPC